MVDAALPATLAADKTAVVPLQGVRLTLSAGTFTADDGSATFGGSAIAVKRIGSNMLVAVTPQLPVGDAAITVTFDGTTYPALTVHVGAAPTPSGDPVTVIANDIAAARASLDTLAASTTNATVLASIDVSRRGLTSLETRFAALAPADQATVLAILDANPSWTTGIAPLIAWNLGAKFIADCALTAAVVSGTVLLTVALLPEAALLAGGIAAYKMLPTLTNEAEQVVTDGVIPTSDFSDQGGASATTPLYHFKSDVPAAVNLFQLFRSVIASDVSSKDPLVRDVARAMTDLDHTIAYVNQIEPAASYALLSLPPPTAETMNTKGVLVTNALHVPEASVTSAAVALTNQTAIESGLELTFHHVIDVTTCTPFTFDVQITPADPPAVTVPGIPADLDCGCTQSTDCTPGNACVSGACVPCPGSCTTLDDATCIGQPASGLFPPVTCGAPPNVCVCACNASTLTALCAIL